MDRFPSKIDWWVALLLVGACVVPSAVGVHNAMEDGFAHPSAFVPLACGVVSVVLIFGLCWPISYEINATHLLIRNGFFSSEILLRSIRRLHPTKNPLSAPALSLDRLQLDYEKNGEMKMQLVSPRDKNGFIQRLQDAVPGLKVG